jgi:tetratricopeptide (TPR) repeat protein
MEAGAQTVLGMRYSVTVSAASLMMPELYRRLFDGLDLDRAIVRARGELADDKQRRAYFQQTIQLDDWVLPVVYQNRSVSLDPQPFTDEQRTKWLQEREARHPEPKPTYGFFGRDLDILKIEKRLLTEGNILLIHGMGGTGKTTLLHHLAAWWQTTGFIDQVFYFGYDEKAWTRQQIMHAIAGRLFDPGRFHGSFLPMKEELQQQDLAEALAGTRHLLILDNLESVTGSPLAIQNTLTEDEQAKVKGFLAVLRGGRSLVLLGSRGLEEWLALQTFGQNVHELPGLDPEAASDLAESILERHEATKWRTDQGFRDLLKLLDGYPLPLEVILPNLRERSPTEVLDALQKGAEGIDLEGESKTESILRCIDYSHGNLSPDAQGLLACLSPFSGVFNTMWLEQYTEHLRVQLALQGVPFDRWQDVVKEAINWGLLNPHVQLPGVLRLQPIFPYFLRTRLKDPQRSDERAAIEIAFRGLYDGVGDAIGEMLNAKEPQQRQIGQLVAELEYANLLSALRLALQQRVTILNIIAPIRSYLNRAQDHARWVEVGTLILSGIDQYSAGQLAGQLGVEFAAVLGELGNAFVRLRRYEDARNAYQKMREISEQATEIPEKIRRVTFEAGAYHSLGMVAQAQRQWAEAEAYYKKALEIYVEFKDRYSQASTYHQLGMVAQAQRQWAEAEAYYKKALEIKIEFKDRYSQASTYHQLGIVAQEQRQWAEARDYLLKDLAISVEFEDHHGTAITLRSLARLWQASGDDGLPAAVGEVLGLEPDKAAALLRGALPDAD